MEITFTVLDIGPRIYFLLLHYELGDTIIHLLYKPPQSPPKFNPRLCGILRSKHFSGSILKHISVNKNSFFFVSNFTEVFHGDQIDNTYALVTMVRRQAFPWTYDGLLLRFASLDRHELILDRYELPPECLTSVFNETLLTLAHDTILKWAVYWQHTDRCTHIRQDCFTGSKETWRLSFVREAILKDINSCTVHVASIQFHVGCMTYVMYGMHPTGNCM